MSNVVDLAARRAQREQAEPWFTKRDAARHLQVSTRTLTEWQRHRGVPHYKVGRVCLYKASELDSWVRREAAATLRKQSP